MTMPDRIQITHQDPMNTPDFRALCAELLRAWQFGDDIAGPMNRTRAALKAEPEGESPTLADVDELCAKFGFHYDADQGESLEMLRDMISASLARWGHPHAAAPAPGENLATPPAPEAGEVAGLVGWLNQVAQYLVDNGVTGAPHVQGAAILLEQQQAELATLRGAPLAELDDQRRAAVHQAVAEALGSDAYDCTRVPERVVWEALQVGTMGEDDFVLVADDSDRVAEIADAAIEAIRAIPAPAPVPVAVSERPWDREGWCDEQGRCWFCNAYSMGRWSYDTPPDPEQDWGRLGTLTHSLPHWAIQRPRAIPKPAPQAGEVEA
jgi:hypothetical protein